MDSEFETTVGRETIDYNGHMNVGHYGVKFEEAARFYCAKIDLSRAYRERTNRALFARESHFLFLREAKLGDRLVFRSRLLDFSNTALHVLHLMFVDDRDLAACNEVIYVHLDLTGRERIPFDEAKMALLRDRHAQETAESLPSRVVLHLRLAKSAHQRGDAP